MNALRLIALILVCSVASLRAATTNAISQWGITWQFNDVHEYGTFANGDFWVVGPVTITNMLPAWGGTNGWEVNPTVQDNQGFNTNGVSYTDALRPSMPFSVTNSSVVKVIAGSAVASDSVIKTAAVLTVLTNAPATAGTNYFRPPYVGTNKPLYLVSSLLTNLLPSYAAVASTPTLTAVRSNFAKCLRMDHHPSNPRDFRPMDAIADYQPENTPLLNEAMLRLMLNDTPEDKREALVYFTQHALDQAYACHLGYRRLDDGHNPNHRVLAAWAATLLNITEIKASMAASDGFHEDAYLYNGINGQPLWGETTTELQYWNYVMGLGGSRSRKDPYGYIDGGEPLEAGSYQFITSPSLKGQALTYLLFTNLQTCIPEGRLLTLAAYARRWVTNGYWTLPDPAAPFDGNTGNYGVTFGPNGSGSYIAGAGRFPDAHGDEADSGQYGSAFVSNMWNAYSDNAYAALIAFFTRPVANAAVLNVGQISKQ